VIHVVGNVIPPEHYVDHVIHVVGHVISPEHDVDHVIHDVHQLIYLFQLCRSKDILP